MNIKTITYGFKRNMGNYESKYVEATAEIDDEDDPTEAFITLQDWVHSQLVKSPNLIGSELDIEDVF